MKIYTTLSPAHLNAIPSLPSSVILSISNSPSPPFVTSMHLGLVLWAEKPKVFIEWTVDVTFHDVTFHDGIHHPLIHLRTILGATSQWPRIYLFLFTYFPINPNTESLTLHLYFPVNHVSDASSLFCSSLTPLLCLVSYSMFLTEPH